MATVDTFWANIYVGLREGYGGRQHWPEEAEAICRAYCDEVGLGLTVTPTRFVYTGGGEAGVIVGLINYPRFPSSPAEVRDRALALGERLRVAFGQTRVSVVTPDKTYMLGAED